MTNLPSTLWFAARTVRLYAIAAGTWIVISDLALGWLLTGGITAETISSLTKGLLFVLVTSLLLYLFVRHSEVRIQRVTRLYRTLSLMNELIMRRHEVATLQCEACRLIVEEGGLRMAWIGLLEPESGAVRPVARWGYDEGYVALVLAAINAHGPGHYPIGMALSSGTPQVCNDIQSDPRMASWHTAALTRGYSSSAAFPICVAERVIGMLNVYADVPQYFTPEEQGLLAAITNTLALALEAAEHEASRRAAETALRASEERYRRLAEQAPDIIYRYRVAPERGFDYVSPAAARIIGYTPEEHYADPDLRQKVVHADDRRLLESLNASINTTEPLTLRWVRRDGQIIWIEQLNVPVYDESGSLIAIEGIARDVTERVTAASMLTRYQLLSEHTRDTILFVRAGDGRITEANQAALAAYGYTREELLQKTIYDLHAPATHDVVALQLAQADDAGMLFETVHQRSDGSTFPVEASSVGTEIGGERVLMSIIRDITERQRAMAELHLLRAALEATANAVVIVDRSDRIEWANPAFTTLTGYSREEAIGQSTRLLKSDRQPPSFYATMWATILDGRVWHGELINRRKDGSLYHEEQTITPVRATGGEITHFISVKQDIGERIARDRARNALAVIAEALRTAHTRAEMLPTLLAQVMELVPAEGAALAIRDPATGETVIEVGAGVLSNRSGWRLAPRRDIVGKVIADGQPYLSNDITQDPIFVQPERLAPVRAALCVPLRAESMVIGALWAVRTTTCSDDDLHSLVAVADFAGNAIHRATLHEKTERHLQRLAGLHTIDRAISSSMDIRLVLHTMLDQTTQLLGVDAADVLLLDSWQNILTYAAGRGFRNEITAAGSLRLGKGIVGRAALERQTMHVPDLRVSDVPLVRRELTEVEDFVCYYGVPLIAKGQLKGVLEIFHRSPLTPDAEWMQFLEALAGQAAIAIDNAEMFDQLQRSNTNLLHAYDATIEGWARALDLRDKETEGHSRRVTEMTVQLARALGLHDDEIVHIRRGALLHDIGKMGVPDHILLKPGPLTDEEWAIMRMHPVYAYELLAPIVFLRPALDIPYCHHEKWDGTGYPRGLKGEEIPLAARLFAVIDVWDALSSDRPYRRGWPQEEVYAYIRQGAGTLFDPRVVEVFLSLLTAAT